MAKVALKPLMRPGKRVVGLATVIEAPKLPAIRVVAKAAIYAEAAFVMGILVTIGTFGRGVFIRLCPMAFLAGHQPVQADQRETRQIVIEDNPLTPAFLIVAIPAVRPQLAFMRIVLLVTGDACLLQLVAIEIAFMACVAFRLGVLTVQRKLRFLIMIETDLVPFRRLMAVLTFRAVTAAMDILQLMAGRTNRAYAFIALARVASLADDFGVRAL